MLVNVPLVNQLTPNTNDGMPSDNAQADCAAASADAAAQALGAPSDLTPDYWKDAAYGEGYTGATDPDHYAPVFARFGLSVQEYRSADGWALMNEIKSHLHAGHPVLGAIPSQWGLNYAGQDMVNFPGGTHEICFCDDDGANLTAMNPWPFSWTGNNAWYQTQPYAWWAERLVYGRVNPVVKVGAMAWTKQADGTGKDARGHIAGQGSMAYLVQNGLTGNDGLMSETFYDSNHAFLPLVGGRCVSVVHDVAHQQWIVSENASQVAVDLWNMLQAAKAAQGNGSEPAGAGAAVAAIKALKAAEGVN